MLSFKERVFSTPDGIHIAAKEYQSEGVESDLAVNILCLHGWLDNANSFDPLLNHLVSHKQPSDVSYHIISVDFPGHGLSSHRHPQAAYLFYRYVHEIRYILSCLPWHKCTLIGHSMGAGVATLVASIMPERISGLVCVEGLGPFTRGPESAVQFLKEYCEAAYTTTQKRPRAYASKEEAAIARATGNAAMPLSVPAATLLVERGTLAVEGGGFIWAHDPRLRLPWPIHWPEDAILAFLRRITCPVLVLMGDTSKFIANIKDFNLQNRVEAVQDCQVTFVPGGHHPHLDESPEECADIIARWIATKNISSIQRPTHEVAAKKPTKWYKL
ncbi:hypothetical protein HDU85_005128 [Gaertneriomyces sp. JEL0708]|nr:hypothetical protein HDU85_005128 [Gaertneriomyces sp. JEL0708]